MSDYLPNLVDRTLGFAPRIEPLIASAHDPAASAWNLTATVEGTALAESQPASAATPASTEPRVPLRETETSISDRTELAPSSAKPRMEGNFPMLLPMTGVSEKTLEKTFSRSVEPAARPFSSVAAIPSARAPTLIQETPLPVGPQRVSTHHTGESHHAEKPGASPSRTDRSPVTPPLIVHPQIVKPVERDAEARPRLAESPKDSSTQPVIHVTIGRIDVRAVMSAAPAPTKAAPSAPKLSLEEYLQQRNGGRR